MLKNHSKGLTLIELMIVLAILVTIIALAAPAFNDALEQRRLERAGEAVFSAIRLARSEAIKQATTVRISFANSDDGWCYGIDDDLSTLCECNHAIEYDADFTNDNCTLNSASAAFRHGGGEGRLFDDVKLERNQTISFTPSHGFASARTVALLSGANKFQVVVNGVGRVAVRSTLPGYPPLK